ncbi:hypothetical protein BN444_04303 [Xanthomonas translucens pv. translucens DSM 18974]|uniref:Uncharacterized protein n=1 Tax=Xanthomonas translucens pv. translucens DSM 18974 TaxID=1261556 RepID=A0A1C3TPK1_XANCT|nr:hypothetical protein BN444_04303 [Xanthomonas translucens pv. translucens DSM 18974]
MTRKLGDAGLSRLRHWYNRAVLPAWCEPLPIPRWFVCLRPSKAASASAANTCRLGHRPRRRPGAASPIASFVATEVAPTRAPGATGMPGHRHADTCGRDFGPDCINPGQISAALAMTEAAHTGCSATPAVVRKHTAAQALSTRLRPFSLARYSAWSARWVRRVLDRLACGHLLAQPMLTVTSRWRAPGACATAQPHRHRPPTAACVAHRAPAPVRRAPANMPRIEQ